MRIGILTNGGDCPGLNRGILEAVRVIEAAGATAVLIAGGYQTLVDLGAGRAPDQPVIEADTIDRRLLGRSGGTFLRSSRCHVNAHAHSAVAGARQLEIDALIVFGGDGSLRGGTHLVDAGLTVVGVPKTIDNDIAETERSIGFATAVQTGVDAVERIYDTARSHGTAFIVETMGRRSGMLAVAIADAVDAAGVCVPERPFDLDALADRLGSGSVVVVAEGAWSEDLGARPTDAAGRFVVGGIGARLVEALASSTGAPIRSVTLGHVLRGGPPVAEDRLLAGALGRRGAACALEGASALALVADGRVTHGPLTSHRRFLDSADLAGYGPRIVGGATDGSLA